MRGTPVPQLPSSYNALNRSLRAAASGLAAGCRVSTTRDNAGLASFRWVCGTTVATATFSLSTGQRLALSDLLEGAYASYLSSTAADQLQLEGKPVSGTSDLSTWGLTPVALDVTFPAGTVAFPLTSLTAYIKPSGPLSG